MSTRAPAPAPEGPLRGIAVGVKDIIDTADMPTEMGSPIYAGWRPKADAPIVTALARAGATPIGKTATTPFAHLDPTPTRNPRNPGHTPGGSSSGSAAAVGAGMVPLALGTQTGGSIIRPASFCGCAAIKPSYRLIPTVGVKCFSWALDTVGMFAATVPDVAYALAAVTGRAEFRIDGDTPPAPRIGVVTQDFAGPPEPDSAAALEAAAKAAETAGASVREIALPAVLGEAWTIHPTLQDYEARQALAWEYATHRDLVAPQLRKLLDEAQAIEPRRYDEARRTARRARGALGEIFGRGRRAPDLLGAGAGAGDAEGDRQRPLQPPLDADGRALRQRPGLRDRRRAAGRRPGHRPLRARRAGARGGAFRRARARRQGLAGAAYPQAGRGVFPVGRRRLAGTAPRPSEAARAAHNGSPLPGICRLC